jgi:hypothetical protein
VPRGDTQGFGQQSSGANDSTQNLSQGESFDPYNYSHNRQGLNSRHSENSKFTKHNNFEVQTGKSDKYNADRDHHSANDQRWKKTPQTHQNASAALHLSKQGSDDYGGHMNNNAANFKPHSGLSYIKNRRNQNMPSK